MQNFSSAVIEAPIGTGLQWFVDCSTLTVETWKFVQEYHVWHNKYMVKHKTFPFHLHTCYIVEVRQSCSQRDTCWDRINVSKEKRKLLFILIIGKCTISFARLLDPINSVARAKFLCGSARILDRYAPFYSALLRRMRSTDRGLSACEQVAGVTGVSRAICISIHSQRC